MSTTRRYRSQAIATKVIGLSIAYQPEQLLSRGLGLEHLKELLVRLARPLLRQGAGLAYGGHWHDEKPGNENFTFDLLRLISAEQEDNSLGGPDTSLIIGRLINHSAWPFYLEITTRSEAQWINCCRVVRVTQQLAGIAEGDIVADTNALQRGDRATLNTALTLSTMRRLATQGMMLTAPDVPIQEVVPPLSARVILGGKVDGYTGFAPGLFEEALLAMEHKIPLFVIGGFGGASGELADAILKGGADRPAELTLDGQKARNPNLAKLLDLAAKSSIPTPLRTTEAVLDALFTFTQQARLDLSATLNTGLDDPENRELLQTRDMTRVVQLVRKGLAAKTGLVNLPA